jgi:hypothetical protein
VQETGDREDALVNYGKANCVVENEWLVSISL